MFTISPSSLADEIEEHFESYTATVSDEEEPVVIVTERIPAGMYYPTDFEVFEQNVEQFIMEYTQSWVVERTSRNRIEGQSTAILRLKEEG